MYLKTSLKAKGEPLYVKGDRYYVHDKKTDKYSVATNKQGWKPLVVPLTPKQVAVFADRLNTEIPDACMKQHAACSPKPTYMNVIRAITDNFREELYIVGGIVRDFVKTKTVSRSSDIDFMYSSKLNNIVSRLRKTFGNNIRIVYSKQYDYIMVGNNLKNSEYLEGFSIFSSKGVQAESLESPANSLMLDIRSGTKMSLIDFFDGKGIDDAKHDVWQAPVKKKDHDLWLDTLQNVLWRLLKFKLRGFTVPDETTISVYKYWYTHQSRITEFEWNYLWKIFGATKVDQVVQQIVQDVDKHRKELGFSSGQFILMLIEKKTVVLTPHTHTNVENDAAK